MFEKYDFQPGLRSRKSNVRLQLRHFQNFLLPIPTPDSDSSE